jgi:predicted membrane protein
MIYSRSEMSVKAWTFERLATFGYSVVATGAIYVESLLRSGSHSRLWTSVGVVLLGGIAGAAIGRWWALALPIVPAILEVPLAFFAPPTAAIGELLSFGIPVAAVGIGCRRAFDEFRREGRRLSVEAIVLVLAYTAGVGTLMLYAASLDSGEEFATSIIIAFFAGHALIGLALGRWRALLLILLLPILAIPVPVPEGAYEPLPLWYVMLVFGGPLATFAMATGIGLRKTTALLREGARS